MMPDPASARYHLLQDDLRAKLLDESGGAPSDLLQAALGGTAPAPAAPVVAPPTGPVYPEDLSDAALARAYDAKRRADTTAQMMNAAALINRGFGGSAPLNAGDAFRAGGDSQIEELQARRQGMDAEQKRRDEEYKRKQGLLTDNPNSPTNQLRGKLLGKFYSDDPEIAPLVKNLNPGQMPTLEQLVQNDVAMKRATKPLGGGDNITPEEREGYVTMLEAVAPKMGWTAEELTGHVALARMGSAKTVRTAFAGLPALIKRTDTSKAIAEAGQSGQNTRQTKALEEKKNKEIADDVSEMGKQITDTIAAVKTALGKALPLIAAAKAKYGDIPGTGLVKDFIGKSRLASAYLNSPEEKDIRGLVESMNILNRTDITGAAFGEKEANDLRAAYADLLNSDNLEQSLGRLLDKVDSAVKKHVATKRPEAQEIFFQRFPEMRPGKPAMSSGGINGAPPVSVATEVQAPPRPGAVAPPVPGAKQGNDGNWYVKDAKSGKWKRVQ